MQLAALCTLFDLILIFGFTCLLECPKQGGKKGLDEASNDEQMNETDETSEEPESEAGEEAQNTTEAILSILSKLLDNDVSVEQYCYNRVTCIPPLQSLHCFLRVQIF